MCQLKRFGETIYKRFVDKIVYDGEYYYLKDDIKQIPMKESGVIIYLLDQMRDEYFYDHLMVTFLEVYVVQHFKRNYYESDENDKYIGL